MLTGTLFALAAGLMWGLVFIAPVLLPQYPALVLTFGRYLAFGVIALPLAWAVRGPLSQLRRSDWLEAARLSLVGNFLYYALLAAAIQRAGTPLASMIIGTLPVVIAIVSNRRNARRDGVLPWGQLVPSLVLVALGIAAVNQAELATHHTQPEAQLDRYLLGAALAIGAMLCWTWYPLRNADWLRAHADRSPQVWATAQGLVTLPMAALGYGLCWSLSRWTDWDLAPGFDWPLGPQPLGFVGLMLAIGLFASWLGTLCWNEASQRLPTTLAGQLIVFETVSALAYAFVLRGRWPDLTTTLGIGSLLAGVVWALRVKPVRVTA